jgi:dienelactone hydrolase
MTIRSVSGFFAVLVMAGAAAAQDRADVVMEMDPGLALHTIYYPREPRAKLGLVVWGNGGCLNDGSNYQDLLSEVAAHGFLVIANGAMSPPALDNDTTAAQLTEAIDWAMAENARAGSKHKDRLDTTQVAAMGHSCGGRQALAVSGDPRVKTSLILNAGGAAPEALAKLHGPVIYFSGGPSDRAHAGVENDFKQIGHVPAMYVELDVGHNGTLFDEKGGAFGRVITQWLRWQLKGSPEGAAWFAGPDCTLCKVSAWRIARKNID